MSARQDLRARTKEYALRIIRLYRALPPRDGVADILGKQLLRSGTSVAAHYREACRAKSDLVSSASSKVGSKSWMNQIYGSNSWPIRV
jgi:four helix bundle protein